MPTPEEFKQKMVQKYPDGVSSTGQRYADMDATDLTKRIALKYPDGVDNSGVKYSDYLKGTSQEIKATPPPTQHGTGSSFLDKVGEFGSQAGRSIFKTVDTISSLGQKTLGRLVGANKPGQEVSKLPEGLTRSGETPSEKAGGVFGEALQYLTPIGAETATTKGITVLGKVLEKSPSIVQGLGKLAVKSAVSGAEFAGKTALMGGSKEDVKSAGILGAVTPPVLKVAGLGAKAISKIGTLTAEKLVGKIDDLVNKIAQGKTKDIAFAKKALSSIDTTGIKTYSDVKDVATSRISDLAKGQDKLLLADNTLYRTSQLDKVTTVGGKQVKTNFVTEALKDFTKHYKSIGDNVNLEKINQLSEKLNTKGLTNKEINDLARQYGTEFNAKSFGLTGMKSGISAQRGEMIRTGVKDASRSLLKNDASKALDTEMTNLYRLKDLSEKMVEKVNKAQAKLTNPTIIQKVASTVGKAIGTVVDVASLGSAKGIMKGLLSRLGQGEVGMTAIEIEASLSKNLKLLDKLTNAKNDTDILSSLDEIIAQVKKDKTFTPAGLLEAPAIKVGAPKDTSGMLPQPNIPYAKPEIKGLLSAPTIKLQSPGVLKGIQNIK